MSWASRQESIRYALYQAHKEAILSQRDGFWALFEDMRLAADWRVQGVHWEMRLGAFETFHWAAERKQ